MGRGLCDGLGGRCVGDRIRFKWFKTFNSFKWFKSFGTGGSAILAAKDDSFKDLVLDQLQELDDIEARRMFGGYGLYRDETFFGIIHKGKLFFKIDDSTVGEYRRRKMKPFRPNAKQTLKSYYQVPVDIIEDMDELREWAVQAIECQTRIK
jgi:DNA transformation protein